MNNDEYQNYFRVRYTPDPKREEVWKVIAAYLQKKYIPEDAAVLDLGAGYCGFINNIRASERYAVDLNDAVLSSAQKGVLAFRQSGTDLARFEENFFDIVFASNFLEHLERNEIAQTLTEASRVLKPKGKLILLQPNFTCSFRTYFDDYTHKQIFTHVSLADLVASFDFKIREVKPRFLPYSLRSRLPGHPLLVKLYLDSPFKPFAGQMLLVAEK